MARKSFEKKKLVISLQRRCAQTLKVDRGHFKVFVKKRHDNNKICRFQLNFDSNCVLKRYYSNNVRPNDYQCFCLLRDRLVNTFPFDVLRQICSTVLAESRVKTRNDENDKTELYQYIIRAYSTRIIYTTVEAIGKSRIFHDVA